MDGPTNVGATPAAAANSSANASHASSLAASARTLELRRGEKPSPHDLAQLHQIAAGFEAIFANTLLGELMTPLAEGGGLGGEGPGSSIVQGLIQTNLGDELAKSGGLGIGRMVERQLAPLLNLRPVEPH
jgi:Rod binding domain-containing protein